MAETIIGAQGEVRIYRIDDLPDGLLNAAVDRTTKGAIIAHSESGAHHILTGDCDVLEHPNPPAGMRIFYAILANPQMLLQDSPTPHGIYNLAPGIYRFAIDREFNPFAEEARISQD